MTPAELTEFYQRWLYSWHSDSALPNPFPADAFYRSLLEYLESRGED